MCVISETGLHTAVKDPTYSRDTEEKHCAAWPIEILFASYKLQQTGLNALKRWHATI